METQADLPFPPMGKGPSKTPETALPDPVRDAWTRLRSGDPSAFQLLWQPWVPALQRVALERVRALDNGVLRERLLSEVPDLLQGLALLASRKLGGLEYRGPAAMLAWFKEVLARQLQDRVDYWTADRRNLRREARSVRRRPRSSSGSSMLSRLADREPTPSSWCRRNERRVWIAAALATLPERRYTILRLRVFSQASWKQIAAQTGAPSASAVRVEYGRYILPALRRALATLEDEDA